MAHIPEDILFRFRLQRCLLFQERIELVCLPGDEQVAHDGHGNLNKQIHRKIPEQEQHHDLRRHCEKFEAYLISGNKVALLVRMDNTAFVHQKVGANGVGQNIR